MMTRNTFLKLCAAAGSLIAAPFAAVAQPRGEKPNGKKRADKGVKVDAGKDRFDNSIAIHEADIFTCKVSPKDTAGDMYIFESIRGKRGGPTLHYHYEQDEWWYILEGEFLFQVGDETFTTKAGDSVFGPRMVPHAFAKTNEGAARMLICFQPAGHMEAFFRSASQDEYTKLSDDGKEAFRERHGFKVIGPDLLHLR